MSKSTRSTSRTSQLVAIAATRAQQDHRDTHSPPISQPNRAPRSRGRPRKSPAPSSGDLAPLTIANASHPGVSPNDHPEAPLITPVATTVPSFSPADPEGFPSGTAMPNLDVADRPATRTRVIGEQQHRRHISDGHKGVDDNWDGDEDRHDSDYNPLDDQTATTADIVNTTAMVTANGLDAARDLSTGFGELLKDKPASASTATDIWMFMTPAIGDADTSGRKPSLGSCERPEATELQCYFCSLKHELRIFTNGSTSAMRRHLHGEHARDWLIACVSFKLKGWESKSAELQGMAWEGNESEASKKVLNSLQPEWTLAGFLDRLIKWIVVDDQADRIVDCPEFRDLLLYCGRQLCDEDIPHRRAVGQLVMEAFRTSYRRLMTDLENSLGSISWTVDMWTSPSQVAFMAVTAHWYVHVSGATLPEQRAALVAFRKISGAHTGRNMAAHLAEVIHVLGVSHKIGQITMDNATNNDTLMRCLGAELQRLDHVVDIDEVAHRSRCFPHIVNIAVQAALKTLTRMAEDEPTQSDNINLRPDEAEPAALEHADVAQYPLIWQDLIRSDIIGRARALIGACRKSPQRRESLRNWIAVGQADKRWDCKPLQLLRDVDTRWSSVFFMVERYLYLHDAIDGWLFEEGQEELSKLRLSQQAVRLLEHIRDFLEHFHLFQQQLSAEKTPTIHLVVPAMECLMLKLAEARPNQPILKHAYDVALDKLKQYLAKCRQNPVYTVAMVLFPPFKINFFVLADQQNPAAGLEARQVMTRELLNIRMRLRKTSPCSSQTPSTPPKSVAPLATPMTPGTSFAANIQKRLEKLVAAAGDGALALTSPATEEQLRSDDARAVEAELYAYEQEPEPHSVRDYLKGGSHMLLQYWIDRRYRLPNLFQLAMDTLPAQGSAVACERVFSSAKRTITDERNRLLPLSVEMRQILKFTHQKERLSLRHRWGVTRFEMAADNIAEELETAMRSGDIGLIDKLLSEVESSIE